jgi:predicted peptidase
LGSVTALRPFAAAEISSGFITVVSLAENKRMIDSVKKFGHPNPKLTVYPDARHNSWTETYDNPELYEWFLKHQRR